MEVSFLQHFTTPISTPPSPHSTKLFSAPRCSLDPKFPSRPAVRKTSLKGSSLPRDRIISFGEHKGKRLGSLSTFYLKWVAKNLKETQFYDWALLADEVLNDPVYRDRIEWEYVQRIMHGDFGTTRIREHTSGDPAAEIQEIAEKFDWDMEDQLGWRKVDLGLLGTSYGGRIPRKKEGKGEEKEWRSTREKFASKASDAEEAAAVVGDRRRERRERRREKSERELGVGLWSRERVVVESDGEVGGTTEESGSDSDGDDQVVLGKSKYPTLEKGGRFPGRESLLKKVINDRKRWS